MTLIVNRKTDNENIKDYQQSLDEIRIYWSEKSVVGRLRDDVSCWWRRLLPASYAQAAQPIHALVHAVIHIVLCSFHSMDFPFNGFCSRAHRLLYRISSGSFFFLWLDNYIFVVCILQEATRADLFQAMLKENNNRKEES